MRIWWSLALAAAACAASGVSSAVAQEPGSISTAGDEDFQAEFVPIPELDGALSADLGLVTHFDLSGAGRLPALGIGAALGWKHFFDIHGALALRARIRGGASWGQFDDVLGHIGLELGLGLRGYSDQWVFGELGVAAIVDLLIWDFDPAAQRAYGTGDQVLGMRVGGGLETDVGLLWYLGPYLFGDLGAQAHVTWVEVGGVSGVSLEMRWRLRFDWGFATDVLGVEADPASRDELFRGPNDNGGDVE